MVTVDVVECPEKIDALRVVWNQIVHASYRPDLLLTHEWFSLSLREFCQGTSPRILLAREGDQVLGIAPFMIQRFVRWGMPIRKLTFLHPGNTYDRGDFLIRERHEEVLKALLEHLDLMRSEWDSATWAGIAEDSPNLLLLPKVTQACRLSISTPQPFGQALVLPICGSWEDYLKERGRHFRKHLNNPEARLKELGPLQWLTVREPEAVRAGLEELYRIQFANREANGESVPESDQRSRRAALFLSDLFSPHGRAEVKLLRLNGRTIAGLFSVVHQGCLYALVIKFDHEFARQSVGRLALHYAVRDAWEEKIERIDFLMRWPYVERWTEKVTRYWKFDCFHRGAFSQGIRFARRYLVPASREENLTRPCKGKEDPRGVPD